ncbi:MAG: hypothetical protein QM496_18830 [Verrucomicrobiota bacterium]
MKTPAISLASIAVIIGSFLAVSPQALHAQKKGLAVVPVVSDNPNNNNKQNPPPAPVVKKVLPRKAVKTKVKVAAVPVAKQVVPPVQKRVEQPKLPAGMKRMGPGNASKEMRSLAKLKLIPQMKRKGNGAGGSFRPVGETSLDKIGDRINDIAFGQAARDLQQIGGAAGFADFIGDADGLILDFGLGGESDSGGFSDLEGFGGNGSSRKDGLPEDAPPSGWGFLGGIASGGGGSVTTNCDEYDYP